MFKFKYFIFILLVTYFTSAQTPLVLTRANMNFSVGNDTLIGLTNMQFPDISPGENQVWDFSNQLISQQSVVKTMKDTNKTFANSIYCYKNLFDDIALGVGYYYNEYYEINNDYYGTTGISIHESSNGLGNFTGQDNDSLNVLATECIYSNPRYLLKFPTTFKTSFTSNFVKETKINLTITNLFITNAPGIKKSYFTVTDTVVGWGKLIVPTIEGRTSPIEVLMVRRLAVQTDSFLLNGLPAPDLLMNAIPLVQGAKSNEYRISFWRENSKIPAMRITFMDSNYQKPEQILIDKGLDIYTSVNEDVADNQISVSPNPSADGKFRFNLNNLQNAGRLVVSDITGQVLADRNITDNKTFDLSLSGISAKGIYFYKIFDNKCSLIKSDKLIFE